MKKILFFFILTAVAFTTVSCNSSSDDDSSTSIAERDEWAATNDMWFASKYMEAKKAIANGDDSWKIIIADSRKDKSTNINDYIVVKVEDPVDVLVGTSPLETPESTDSVKVHYRGRLYTGLCFDTSWTGDFDVYTAQPIKGIPTNYVVGFSTALTHMKVGEHWRVYMNSSTAYNRQQQTAIPAYSSLVFEIILAKAWHPKSPVLGNAKKKVQ